MPAVKPDSSVSRPTNFHGADARSDYTSRFRAIGISAVAASGVIRRPRPAASPTPRDLPAILRNGFDD